MIEPFKHIPDVEGKHQQLKLLTEVNSFVVHQDLIFQKIPAFQKDKGPKCKTHVLASEEIFKN